MSPLSRHRLFTIGLAAVAASAAFDASAQNCDERYPWNCPGFVRPYYQSGRPYAPSAPMPLAPDLEPAEPAERPGRRTWTVDPATLQRYAAVYAPVGGGGLIAGVAVAIKGLRPGVRVIGVEPAGAAKMTASRQAGRPVTLEKTSSIADGLMAVRPGEITFAHVQALVDDIITVDDRAIASAIGWLFREARIVAEPSGATSVAGALQQAGSLKPGAVAVVSGGNVSPEDYIGYLR